MSLDLNVILDIIKVGVGLVYLYLEYHARRSMWIASIVMPCIGMWLYLNKGLYADCAINLYYLAIAVYGWAVWSGHISGKGRRKGPSPIRHVPWGTLAKLVFLWMALWALVAGVLVMFTDSTVPVLDSFTTSLSVVGMWMLARKYIEQWWVWLVADSVYVYQYWLKGIYFSAGLYVFYAVMAVLGYLKWRRLMRQAACI